MCANPIAKPDPENSLMVVTTREEYCFLWDPDCLPELVESLLGCGETPDDLAELSSLPPLETRADRPLTVEHFRTVVRELLAKRHREL
jgi:hypothetical protein